MDNADFSTSPRFAVVAAMQEEVSHILEHMQSPQCERIAGRNFWTATFQGHAIVIVLSGIGKVAAAITATTLIERFKVNEILFTGVAGSISASVAVGDLVVGTHLIQHDMDASPLFPRYVVPGFDGASFTADPEMSSRLTRASLKVLMQLEQEISSEIVYRFKLQSTKVHEGLILSGDQFVSNDIVRCELGKAHPSALVVEMEGAAVAQVCKDYGVAFAVMRTVSDAAGEQAAKDFAEFLNCVASPYSALIVEAYLSNTA